MPGVSLGERKAHLSFRGWPFKKCFISIYFTPSSGFAVIRVSSPVLATSQVQVRNQAEACPFQHCGISISLPPRALPGGWEAPWDREGGSQKKKKRQNWKCFDRPNPLSLDICLFAFFFLFQASDFGQIGLDLEAEFEKDLKEVFIFCKANESSFQTL